MNMPMHPPPVNPPNPTHKSTTNHQTIKTSAMGTINMLGLAKRVKARILLTSTSEVRPSILSPLSGSA